MPNLDSLNLPDAFSIHLNPDEQLKHWAYGIKQSIGLMLLMYLGAFMLGAVLAYMIIGEPIGIFHMILMFILAMGITSPFIPKLRKDYLVGLTNNRLLILRIKTPLFKSIANPQNQIELTEYPLENLPQLKITIGRLQSQMKIDNTSNPFIASFKSAIKGNRKQMEAIMAALNIK